LASYARQSDRFAAAGTQVAGIVVDSVEQNRAMVDKLLLTFPILSDPDGRVIRDWGVWTDAEGGIALPSLFLVRPPSAVVYDYVGTDFADRPTDEELWAAIGELKVG
jgi:peroxiredoxin Q/BCP